MTEPASPRRFGSPRPAAGDRRPPDVVLCVDAFAERSETFVVEEARALRRLGAHVVVQASVRARAPRPDVEREFAITYLEDDGRARQAVDLAWLLARHPVRALRDRRGHARWAREEPVRPLRALAPAARRLARARAGHLHAHFAAGAALDAQRLAALLGLPHSVTAHAYDIYAHPHNLREKLERASFATSGCAYTVEHLRGLAGPAAAERVHELIMGVDVDRLRRSNPLPGEGRVIAVGRLVEKKGFEVLVAAAALLDPDGPVSQIDIVGEGPLRAALAAQIEAAGVGDRVRLLGARDPEAIGPLLEGYDLLAAPCVVAADGDRDSMPVVVKEALAMELMVVASDAVGLPEIVAPAGGTLVPPGDPAALAAALEAALARPPEERAQLGRRGRAVVAERCGTDAQARRLLELIAAAAPGGG